MHRAGPGPVGASWRQTVGGADRVLVRPGARLSRSVHRGPTFDVVAPPDLSHVEAGHGLGEPVAADELLDALPAEVAEEPGDLGGPHEIVGARAGSHLTNPSRTCDCLRVVKRLAGR